jgi:hypothetical protein
MQRRAAAIYVALFVVLGAASYGVIATATAPTVGFDDPDHRLAEGDQFSAGDRQYTVSAIEAETSGGGHGGAATVSRSGALAWTNDSARYTQTWDNDSTVTYQDETYRVLVASGDDPSSFDLREEINRTAILQDDPAVRNETVTVNDTEYVVRESNGTRSLTRASDYFPTPATTEFDEGKALQFRGNETTVATVASDGVTVAWTAPRTNTVEVDHASNVTVGDTRFFAYFPDNGTMVLESDYEAYERQTQEIDTYRTYRNGLWGVSVASFATAILLLGMAYMPSRY